MNVLLVDANNLAHRSYHAQNLQTSTGQNTGMVYGFINSMLTAVRDLKPDLIYYVWDPKDGSAFRKALYQPYKANRDAKSADFFDEMGILKTLLTALACTQLAKLDVEADDVIGYLAKEHFKDHDVIVYSNDKDMLQLVSQRVKIYRGDKGITELGLDGRIAITEQNKTIYLEPKQVADYKALVGDPSDNYPGLQQFGIAAAITYFSNNKSAMDIVNCTAKLDGLRQRAIESIINDRMTVKTFYELATIRPDLGGITITSRPKRNDEMVKILFDQLEFKQFSAIGEALYCIGGK